MDYKEEQTQEIEILLSIYPDELTILNDSQTRFSINVVLDTDSQRKHAVSLLVTYPETYPDVIPDLSISKGEIDNSHLPPILEDESESENEEEDDNFAGSRKLVDLIERITLDKDDYEILLDLIKEEAEINIGMPSVFALASSLKDHAETQFQNKFENAENKILHAREEKEKKEQAKFNGTKVTPESFAKWRDNFRKETGMDQRLQDRYKSMHAGKFTGKEIWDKGLATGADADVGEEGGDVDLAELRRKMKEASLEESN
ncbi:Gir2 protein [Martiniozyma asiatica (nom. inval.)]|nr:Gir2 protein [Martiniozyma asiatica]